MAKSSSQESWNTFWFNSAYHTEIFSAFFSGTNWPQWNYTTYTNAAQKNWQTCTEACTEAAQIANECAQAVFKQQTAATTKVSQDISKASQNALSTDTPFETQAKSRAESWKRICDTFISSSREISEVLTKSGQEAMDTYFACLMKTVDESISAWASATQQNQKNAQQFASQAAEATRRAGNAAASSAKKATAKTSSATQNNVKSLASASKSATTSSGQSAQTAANTAQKVLTVNAPKAS